MRISVPPKTRNGSLLATKLGANTGRLVLVILLSTALAVLSFSSEWLFDLNRRCECAVVASGTQLFTSRLHNQWLSAIPALIN